MVRHTFLRHIYPFRSRGNSPREHYLSLGIASAE